jgi:hypothetical protein
MDPQLWGICSVRDHLERNAFVAELLLYDRLVLPVPPKDDNDEWRRWEQNGWRPEEQERLLTMIPKRRVFCLPWTKPHRDQWEQESTTTKKAMQPVSRTSLAAGVDRDLAFGATRRVIANFVDQGEDERLRVALPRVKPDVVAAFGSFSALRRDIGVTGRREKHEGHVPTLRVFGWRFLVPDPRSRSHEDLLKISAELAEIPETQHHREAFHRWRKDHVVAATPTRDMLQEMEETVGAYHKVMRKQKIKKLGRHAFAVTALVTAVGGAVVAAPAVAGAVGVGLLTAPSAPAVFGTVAAFAGFGSYLASDWNKSKIPEKLMCGAMFHSARKHFGWQMG